MLNYKIVSDSSSDLLTLLKGNYAQVPMKVITSETEYIDDENLNADAMTEALLCYKGRSQSSCPNVEDWKTAFGDAEHIFCVTITSGLSGSYNAAQIAMNEHLEEHPEKSGYVFDSLSAGPEVALILEKIEELVSQDASFDEIVEKTCRYQEKTRLNFALSSLKNLANNGRISPAVAKISGLLGIRVTGRASEAGTLEVTGKAKGEKKAISLLLQQMQEAGYRGGKVRIHHCRNLAGAEAMEEAIKKEYPHALITIEKTRGLCSFYAENGGLLVGYEL